MVRRRTSARKKRAAYQGLGAAPAKQHGAWVVLVLAALVFVNLYVFVWNKKTGVAAIRKQAEAQGTPSMTIPAGPLAEDAGAAAPTVAVPSRTVHGKVGKDDTIGKLLKHAGLSAGESDEVIRALSGSLDFRSIQAGQPYRIERARDGRVVRFELVLDRKHRVEAVRQATGELAVTTDDESPARP